MLIANWRAAESLCYTNRTDKSINLFRLFSYGRPDILVRALLL